MDILAARKKAAERAKERQDQGPEAPVETPSAPVDEAPRVVEAGPPPPVEVSEPAAGQAAAPAAHEASEGAGHAATDDAEQAPAREIELLSFRLGSEEYAVMVDDVKEVLKLRDLTPVPNTPGYVLGVTSLRGRMLPVVDLCQRLGLTTGVRDNKSRIIVVNPDEEEVGLIVDRVTGVVRIMEDAVKPAPENVEQGAEYLRGIVRLDEKLYILLDLQKAVGV
jgi:chemotaxis signal transduction protein